MRRAGCKIRSQISNEINPSMSRMRIQACRARSKRSRKSTATRDSVCLGSVCVFELSHDIQAKRDRENWRNRGVVTVKLKVYVPGERISSVYKCPESQCVNGQMRDRSTRPTHIKLCERHAEDA